MAVLFLLCLPYIKDMDKRLKSNGENYQPIKIKVKIARTKILKVALGGLTVAVIVLGVLFVCGY